MNKAPLKIAFLGLGVMGFPMALHLHRASLPVAVYNRSAAPRENWRRRTGEAACLSPAEAVEDADVIFSCLGADADVMAVMAGEEGVLKHAKAGALIVDHTTCSANLARELAQQATAQGLRFIDAPVSGGQAGAENGQLTIMIGGAESDVECAAPIMKHYAKRLERLGPVGHGQLCKMVNQICIAGLVQGLAEGLHFAQRAGLNIEEVVSVIGQGAAQSWQMDNRHQNMAAGEYEHGFAVDWMRKDLDYVLQEARSNGSRLPVTALVDQFYADVQSMGGGRWDTSSLLARLQQQVNEP